MNVTVSANKKIKVWQLFEEALAQGITPVLMQEGLVFKDAKQDWKFNVSEKDLLAFTAIVNAHVPAEPEDEFTKKLKAALSKSDIKQLLKDITKA